MRLIVSEIPEAGLHREIELPIALEDDRQKSNVHVFIKISRFGSRVLVEGHVETSVALICSRCLKEFLYPLNVNFKDEYVPRGEVIEEYEHELTNEELDLSFYSNDEIDIEELVREQLLLSVPMKPLCKSDCQGICPKCGRDLNKGLCTCGKTGTDPRLAPLKKFLKDQKE
jgi:uncharacterized protein